MINSTGSDHDWPVTTLLGGLSRPARAALLTRGAEVEQPRGRAILRQGALERHVYVLLNGMVKVTAATENGHEALLGIRIGGDLVGEMGALEGRRRTANVVACGPLVTRVLQHSELTDVMTRYPEIAIGISKMISARLRSANRRRIEFTAHSARMRVCRVLIELMIDHGVQRGEHRILDVPLTQPELASLAGIKSRTVEKELRSLQALGVVEWRYRRISVIDMARLRSMANEAESRM